MASLQIEEKVPLAPLTTIGIGGPARFFLRVSGRAELEEGIAWAAQRNLPLFFLGGGSNLLISDEGFPGLVIRLELKGLRIDHEGLVTAAAGEVWDSVVAEAVSRDFAGIECLSGIPGSIGATPIQNVGAYGQDVSETIVDVEVLDRTSGEVKTLSNEECHFSYRQSLFKSEAKDRYVVLGVRYALRPGGAPTVRYPDLQRYLEEHGAAHPTLGDVRDAIIAIRRRKGMVLDPADPDTRSDGSFFMNPIVTEEELSRFLEKAEGEKVPTFPASGGTKISAAWLIEHAGFAKGYRRGNVGISSKHTLALVNRGGGTAVEMIAFVEEIQDRVEEKFGVRILPEPNFIGFGDEVLRGIYE